ncbi:MAG: NUDIX domain-containing protein [candidate division KSB1 bacterium]|nr:NUDIX domain-containing protein [candidate division KSB1 bacterium]MDZ7346197.1 NUDIX domain-containing protein [candidate division KSB1 bacterium]
MLTATKRAALHPIKRDSIKIMTFFDDQVYTLQFCRSLSIQQTSIVWTPEPLTLPTALTEEIERHWASLSKEYIFNGGVVRLDSWELTNDHLTLHLRPSDYRTLLYSNSQTEAILRDWGAERLSRALGISAVLTSRDDRLFFIRRSERVGEFPGAWDVFGGHIEPPRHGKPDVFAAMTKELEEEVGIHAEEMELCIIGLIESTPNRKPELIFSARSLLDSEQIRARALKACDRKEYSLLADIPRRRETLAMLLCDPQKSWSPSAFASLAVYYELIS